MKIEIKHVLNLISLLLCLLPVWTWAASYEVATSTSIVDGDTFCGGSACTSSDTIIIQGGVRGNLLFRDFNGNGSYITIKNDATNRVVITHDKTAGWGILSFYNCKYIDFRGNNNASFNYGIKVVSDGTPNIPAGNVWIYGKSDHFKLGYIEIDFASGIQASAGSGIKVGGDKSLTSNWIYDNFEIHHNYIHDTVYAGMYLGFNKPHFNNACTVDNSCPYLADFSIHDNLLENIGSYGITFKGIKTGSTDNYIYNNTIRVTGLNESINSYAAKQGIGIQFFYGTAYAKVYNNRIEKTHGAGIKAGEANHLIHDNEILGCGSGNNSFWGHGIAIFSTDYMPNRPNRTVKISDNIIVESTRYGIKVNNGSGYYFRNIIAENGIGEALAYGTLIEGIGMKANIYEADADDVGFQVWIDDGDYSNDDFSLSPVPPATGLHIVE